VTRDGLDGEPSEVMPNLGGVLAAISAVIARVREASSPLTPVRSGGEDAIAALNSQTLRLSLSGIVR
jgi:hypothetical protein